MEILSPGVCFKTACVTGEITLIAANAPIWSVRWTDSTKKCAVQGIKWWWTTSVAFAAAQMVSHALYRATAWTVADSDGVAVSMALLGGSKITEKGSSLLGATNMRVSNTAAITAGTRTLAAAPLIHDGAWSSGAGVYLPVVTQADFVDEGLIWLGLNEGLVLNNMVLMGAAGKLVVGISVDWVEVPLNINQ